MTKYTITATMQDGSAWETVRWTRSGLDTVVKELCADSTVRCFNVVEKSIKIG